MTKRFGLTASTCIFGFALAILPPSAFAQDEDNPAPARPIEIESGDLLSNATIELRRMPEASKDVVPDEENAEGESSSLDESADDEESINEPLANGAESPVDPSVEANRSAESAMPLGADTGLFSLGGSNEPADEDDTAPSWMAGIGGEFARTLGGLSVVLGLLFGLFLLVKRFGGPMAGAKRPAGVLEIMARYPIGRRQHLVLLKMGRRIVLLHQTGTEMRTLADVHDADEVADLIGRIEAGSRDPRFTEALDRETASYRGVDRSASSVSTVRRGNQDVEMVDLTRASGRWRRVLPRWGVNA